MLSKTELKRLNSKKYWEGAIRESNNYGKFEIVEYIDSKNVRVRFLDTGYQMWTALHTIREGTLKDNIRDKHKYEGDIYISKNYGKFEIVKYVNYKEVHVRFLDTGFETKTCMGNIRRGCVMDRLLPKHYGIGYIGDGFYTLVIGGIQQKLVKYGEACYRDVMIKIA